MKRLGKLKEILSQLIQLEKNSETAKDGRVIYWEGELAEGTALFVLDEEGNEVACPDGEVIIEDKKIVVADGKVSTIETVAAEEPKAEEPKQETEMKNDAPADKASKFSAVADFYSMSYDERWQLLYKAAEELYPDSFLYVEDAGDDYAVICLYGDDETKLYKYSVTWEGDEKDTPTLSNPVEVKRGYIPVNENAEPAPAPAEPSEPNEPATETTVQMAEQTAELEALRTEVEELRAKLAQPAKMSEQKRLEEMESNENLTDKYAAIAAALRKR